MLIVFILAGVLVSGIIIAGLIIFLKKRKENEYFDDLLWDEEDEFDDFSWNEEEDETERDGAKKGKFNKNKVKNPIIKWIKSPWWIMVGVIIALIRFCDGVDSSNNKEKLAKISEKQATSQSVEEMYKEFFDKAEEYEEKGEYEKAEEYYLKAAKYNNDIYALIGRMYYDNGDEEKGIKRLKEAYEKGAYSAAGMLGETEEEKLFL